MFSSESDPLLFFCPTISPFLNLMVDYSKKNERKKKGRLNGWECNTSNMREMVQEDSNLFSSCINLFRGNSILYWLKSYLKSLKLNASAFLH